MKTFKSNKTVELLLNNARTHIDCVDMDLHFVDMADEELNVAFRLAEPKKGYTAIDVLNEMDEYTGWNEMLKNSNINDYVFAVKNFMYEYKHKK
jgi:hypothetical protein